MRLGTLLFLGACGGLVPKEPVAPGDASAPHVGDAGDAGEAGDAIADALPLCSADATGEAGPCMPPADDVLFPKTMDVNVAAGGFGAATFIGTGPWVNDPLFYIQYQTSSFEVIDDFSVAAIGSPQTVVFQPQSGQAGREGTLTVIGSAGYITRTATVSVHITACQPLSEAVVCMGSECGLEPDGCGGVVECGTCSGANPYCWQYQCIPFAPHGCGDLEGFDPTTGNCVLCPCGVKDDSCEGCGQP
jgi:hypothetical protein